MYIYRDKKLFLQSFHPLTIIVYAGVLLFLALACNHPVLLIALYAVLLINIKLVDAFAAYKTFVPFLIILLIMIILINPLFNRLGSTVLLTLPDIPVMGRIAVTLEALLYGFDMGLRLLVVITIFFLYNQTINPDRAFELFARLAPRTAMLVALTTRLIPYLAVRLKNIKEVQQTRGVAFDQTGLIQKINSYYPLLKVITLTSLENALGIAEAIQSRAYGSGPRSHYSGERMQVRDMIILSSSLALLLLGVALLVPGWAQYRFYPQLGVLFVSPRQLLTLACLLITAALPAFLNWGWKYWPYLRWKL
ncbi:energy-coupling factor transporter transmembrane component T family protein [Desulfoscipio sp. XC116]|uniref:energy-coupling factor transporter transmembrane component T family protein n=1 Tax=Desulfoscipio sp. XC116 TaxID=3144975 RepID=UPI00325A501A